MKFVIVGNEDECLGFLLAGVKGIVVNDEVSFIEQMKVLLANPEIGVVAVVDRYFGVFSENFNSVIKKQAVPAVIFIPCIDGIHHEISLKEHLASILGIRL